MYLVNMRGLIKTKTGENLVKAFEKILRKGRKPETFHSEKGTEFTSRLFQKYLKKNNIRFFTTKTLKPRHLSSKDLIVH